MSSFQGTKSIFEESQKNNISTLNVASMRGFQNHGGSVKEPPAVDRSMVHGIRDAVPSELPFSGWVPLFPAASSIHPREAPP